MARDYLQFRRQFAHERQHAKRVERQRQRFGKLLGALDYEHAPHNHVLDDGDEVPVLFAGRRHGAVSLLVLGAYDAAGEDEDPLALKPHPAQFHGEAPPPEALHRENWSAVVTRRIFGQSHPPRWVILLAAGQVLLIERGKWTHNHPLRFVLDGVLGRREVSGRPAVRKQLAVGMLRLPSIPIWVRLTRGACSTSSPLGRAGRDVPADTALPVGVARKRVNRVRLPCGHSPAKASSLAWSGAASRRR